MSKQTKERQRTVRKALMADVAGIKALIDAEAETGEVLPRTRNELYECLRDFHVFEKDGAVAGCCALHIDLEDLAEIRSLVVHKDFRGHDAGRALVEACIGEARDLGIARVYALTRVERFFRKLGFQDIDKHDLPSKVFRDCVRCPLFPDCDEVAVALDLNGEPVEASQGE